MEVIKEESEDMKIEETFKHEDTEEQTKMEVIKEESEDMRIEETFTVKDEEQTGCRPMNNPGDMRMDNGGSSDEESDCVGSSESPEDHNTSRENDAEDEASNHGSASKAPTPPPPPAEPKPQAHCRRKGRKTPIMEAMDKGLDRLLQNENTHDFDRERFEWEKEMERNRMELERKRLDFQMKKMEADEKRAEENRALMHSFSALCPNPTIHLFQPLITTLIHHLPNAHQLRSWTIHLQSLDPLPQQHIKCTTTMTHPSSVLCRIILQESIICS